MTTVLARTFDGVKLDWWLGFVQTLGVMPRKVRVQYPGAMDLVMSRGDQRDDIFLDDVDRPDFIKTLAEAGPPESAQAAIGK